MEQAERKQVMLAQDIVSSMQVRVLTDAQVRDQLARVARALARALELDAEAARRWVAGESV